MVSSFGVAWCACEDSEVAGGAFGAAWCGALVVFVEVLASTEGGDGSLLVSHAGVGGVLVL